MHYISNAGTAFALMAIQACRTAEKVVGSR